MESPPGSSNIFTRYDLAVEVKGQQIRKVSEDLLLQRVADCVVAGDEKGIGDLLVRVLETKGPLEVINRLLKKSMEGLFQQPVNGGLIAGMGEVSRLWAAGVFFLPQVILLSDAMIAGIALCEKRMGKPVEKRAKVVTHTAEGDIHDIGQVIVNALLNAAGFEVINLGADVPVEKVVEACAFHRPVMVTGTALMTTTMTAFPRIAERLKQAGLMIPFVCGGGERGGK